MKKNKLYTANKWNQPAFMSPRGNNLFWGDPGSSSQMNISGDPSIAEYKSAYTKGDYGSIYTGGNYDVDAAKSAVYGGGSTGDTGAASSGSKGFGKAAALQAAAGVGLEIADNMGRSGDNKRGLWDVADPMHHLAGGRESAVGNALGDVGVGLFKAGAQSGNPWLMLAGGVSKFLGSGINGLFGTKVDKVALDRANMSINTNRNFVSNAETLDELRGPASMTQADVYTGSLFNSADDKNEALRRDMRSAFNWADASIRNNARNIISDKYEDNMRRFSAFGGPLDIAVDNNDMGAINYGFMQDYLTNKKQEISNRNKMAGLTQMPAFMPNSFAIGGDLQVNGGDWTTGLTHIDAGLSHEENPNEGVQLGVDSEGTPNLVEENETVWNDYVFSNRILADKATKQMFRLPKKKDITFADISKRLEKEITERPNDPISKAGFEKQMQMLEEQQERQKQEMEAERAKAAFEALSPEEQTALMQQKAEQEAMAQQAAMQEAAAQQQPTPEEIDMVQQQMQQADGSNAVLGQEPENLTLLQQNVNALGGELVKVGDVEPNRFDYGGKKGSRKAKRVAKKYDEQWFKNMAKSLGISDKEMEGFAYSADDPEANLVAFNNIYRDNQYNKSKDIYRKGQRQSKRNELFGDRGLYSYSDDKSKIYKARTNDADRTGWINKDYTGATDAEGRMLGFLSQEEYDKLKPEEKEAYKRINERAGDRMYDYNGRIIKDLYNGTEDDLLNSFDTDYDKGFKWDDKDAQTLQYPVDMEHSATSAMRYIPAIGGAIGLANDIFSSPDYSRPQAIIEASRGLSTPSQVQPHYIGNYLTYRPLDIWYQQNALNAQSRATDRNLINTSGSNRGAVAAGLLANGYNSQIASGNLFRQAQEYNDSLGKQVEDFNRGTNIFNANADMDSQKTNAMLRQQAGRLGLQGLMTGYGMMDDIDARRQASMSANLTNVLQSLGNIGEEAYDEDRLRWLERTGTLKSSTL